jgi:hypothetical protein
MRQRRVRDTGPSRKVRAMVLARDGYACVRCGVYIGLVPGERYPHSIHHRIDRSLGGTNDPANLLTLCGSGTTLCHGVVTGLDRWEWLAGYWLRSWQDPRQVPVLYYDVAVGGRLPTRRYLHSDGSLQDTPEGQ